MDSRSLTFELSNGGHLKISKEALQMMNEYKQVNKKDPEGGGIIMGRFIRQSKNIIIDKLTEPAKEDKRTRYSFKRKSIQHQIILEDEWKRAMVLVII